MKRFLIEEGERERILNMYKIAIKKQYLSEQDLTRIIRKVISEQSTDTENLYSAINALIDREYSDMDPEDIQNVLHNIFNTYKAISYRKRRGRDETHRDDVMKRFR